MTELAEPSFDEVLVRLRQDPHDQQAWERFARVTLAFVRARLRHLGERDSEHRADLAQDVIVRFLRYSPWRLDGGTGMPTAPVLFGYLTRVAYSVFVDDRKARRRRFEVTSDEDLQDRLPSAGDTGPFLVDEQLTAERLERCLTPPERVLFALLQRGAGTADVARLLEITYSAAGARMSRLKQKLFACLQDLS